MSTLSIQDLWNEASFEPNEEQREAILHTDGPLFITAGPGSGKTRVLLWRTLNLIVFHGVEPDRIFLSTFTEKAAKQLHDGIRLLLARVTNRTGQQYDTSRMYVGTAHSLCRKLILDRRFSDGRERRRAPVLLDELGQYFRLARPFRWRELTAGLGWGDEPEAAINGLFSNGDGSMSRHAAVRNTMALFNRLSEELIDADEAILHVDDPVLKDLLQMYLAYRQSLAESDVPLTDFALLQQEALRSIESSESGVFSHVIIDEYQDTNHVQERLFFSLAKDNGNICVVGDDDQALYRFRGATVENFVEFPDRCSSYLGVERSDVTRVTLSNNYRSLVRIVNFFTDFIDRCDWARRDGSGGQFRVHDKNIVATRDGVDTAVVASEPGHPDEVCREVAGLVARLVREGKVEDPNQIAFLFPSLKGTQVARMTSALERESLKVYAPRAGRFLEVEESVDMFGVMLQLFGKPERGDFPGTDYREFHNWLDRAHKRGNTLLKADTRLDEFVGMRRAEIDTVVGDQEALLKTVTSQGWELSYPYEPNEMKRALHDSPRLSDRGQRILASARFDRFAHRRAQEGRPYDLGYVITRATSLDWTVLELFYQLCGFDRFRRMLDLAEEGIDEGPICNLGLISEHLSRFMDDYSQILTANTLLEDRFVRVFFGSYLYALYRLGESEYEDSEDPFPKGRIPFLTIHQAKGLEFPVVALGNPRKADRGPQRVEELVRPMLDREAEPLDRLGEFDNMRLFYVALSRAKNLLILPHWRSRGNYVSSPFREMLDDHFPRIAELDPDQLPVARLAEDTPPKNYSYTGDYLLYQRCPRQYMVFQKYGFAPATTQTMFFGRLVHQTLEDLHEFLIARREEVGGS